MAEALSPNPKRRPPFASPTKSPIFLRSNDDKLERAQARAAAARRNAVTATSASFTSEDPCLEKDQILELFHNCVKLASENKINQKNTWELNLIDHLYEIINVEEENDAETNFQKASCTLEAGVKIYSTRVDSVHSEAYKVLGGINRVGQEDEQDRAVDESGISNEQEESKVQRDQKKLSPLSTLESSFAAINVKKFDAAFVVDPLYHQTSAQFDEGGAKGLLLNNLGVYANCRVLFDSSEIPGKCESSVAQSDASETIDLSFAKECIETMVLGMVSKAEISPSLSAIIDKFDKDNRRPSEVYSSAQVSETSNINVELDGDAFSYDQDDDQASIVDEGSYDQEPNLPTHEDVSNLADEPLNFNDAVENERFEDVDDYLFLSLGFPTKQNAWAGPGHWKYRKVKDPENQAEENGSPKAKRTKKNKADIDIGFLNALDKDFSHIFAPPKNPKSLLLPANRAPCNTKLPEDCHYQPENLVKLFLLPNVLCLGRSGRKRTDEAREHANRYGQTASWDEEYAFGGGGAFDDGHDAYSDNEESSTLVSQPRQVSKIEVQYDKTSKQVDVHALKETLWDQIQKLNGTSVQLQMDIDQEETVEKTVSFKQVLGSFSDGCRAASPNDISPHLCFICLLHLANEHGLRIDGYPSLDDLSIHLKSQ